jgi:Glycosyltransferase family 9 (heptosyltransferase)
LKRFLRTIILLVIHLLDAPGVRKARQSPIKHLKCRVGYALEPGKPLLIHALPFQSPQDALTKSLTMSTPVRIMLTGSKNERPMLQEIASNMQSPAVLVTDATIGQLATLQAKALLVLSVDSRPLHLALSQATPTIQLFGPTDRIFGPWGKKKRHIPCGRLDFSPQEVVYHPCVCLRG